MLVTTATVFWIFLLPTSLGREVSNPYIGILAFPAAARGVLPGAGPDPARHLPAVPEGAQERLVSDRFSAAQFSQHRSSGGWSCSSSGATLVNIVIAGQTGYSAVSYMESVTFCGQTCHTVMQPEFAAYQNSPHSRVECVKCHIGPGASWFVRSKLSGVGQVFAVTFNTYQRPIPTPVRNLRPARETCEACHWPEKFGEDRLRVIEKFADDEENTRHQDRAADAHRRRPARAGDPRHAPRPGRRDPLHSPPTNRARTFPGWSTPTARAGRPRIPARMRSPRRSRICPCARWTAWTATTGPRTPSSCPNAPWTRPCRVGEICARLAVHQEEVRGEF